MPDPREAAYDVLLAKKRRAEEQAEIERRRVERGAEFSQSFEEWNEANRRAGAAVRP